MGSKWRKAKVALGLNLCMYSPRGLDDNSPPPSERLSDAALLPAPATPMTPTPSTQGLRLSKSLSRSSKKPCAICLGTMRCGDGLAIFTAECSHSFHFHCIASNVKHGSQVCPVCRANWKDIPFQGPILDPLPGRGRISPIDWSQDNALLTVIHQLPPPRPNPNRRIAPLDQSQEPAIFNDDEVLDHQLNLVDKISLSQDGTDNDLEKKITIKTFPEVPVVPRLSSSDSFTVLIHLKAPLSVPGQSSDRSHANMLQVSQTPRAPVDLVTVLDISGSMAGTKLALLKRAMGFVIQNLGPNDRLSVIAFSSTARRLFPLRRMSDTGRQQVLQAVNSLAASGGTNIAEGLRKGAKVLEDRRENNPVSSIILLSDGQDTYTTYSNGSQNVPNYQLLLPMPINGSGSATFKIPVHAFGFGMDHDASSMHSISEISGGTFSFIETEAVIQDAFAQCIGGLLSVVVKELQVAIECIHPKICIDSVKAGSYPNHVTANGCMGFIDVGDLYADEERDFLVTVNIPAEFSSAETSLLKVKCIYNDPVREEVVTLESGEVKIKRPETAEPAAVSVEVDRQRNRLQAAEVMAQARAAAERGDLTTAASILENCRKALAETVSAKSCDRLCVALDAELKEMQERMVSRHVYEASGRAYILSGLSSHSWQRATARGDSTDGSSLVRSYQTPLMADMLIRSQAALLGSPAAQRLLRPVWSLPSHPKPR